MKKDKINLFSDLSKLDFLNNKQIENISKYFGDKVSDYLLNCPTDIINKCFIEKLDLKYISKLVTIDLTVINHKKNFKRNMPFKIICKDNENQKIDIILFNTPGFYISNLYKINETYRITGTLQFFNKTFQIIHPNSFYSMEKINEFEEIEPIYNLKKKKIKKTFYRKIIIKTLSILDLNFFEEWISSKIINKYKWLSFEKSLFGIHHPKSSNIQCIEIFRKRLAFDELFSNLLMISFLKKERLSINNYLLKNSSASNKIINSLSFSLTNDQLKAFKEIQKNLFSQSCMYRLLQGDVGSGKTIVALLAIADILNSGFQAVLMAPSEILAQQHYIYFKKILANFNFQIRILTGKINKKEKNLIYEEVSKNKINLIIGTHALFNKEINFFNLGIIVIDEQHKFGVNQRLKLQRKSKNCNVLVMSATPIPRSLTFAIYGEMEVSLIRNKPPGRQRIETSIINIKKINQLVEGIKRIIDNNQKVFWVVPEIGDDDKKTVNSSIFERYENLKQFFGEKISFVHGKMNKEIVNETMIKFRSSKIMILISTSLIEVGIDIPDASTIVIENANKFGLAQLHQLRGRVGRGKLKSYCILIHNNNLNENALARLNIMKQTDDGFLIAEEDLRIRGGGDVFGTKQTGLPNWKFFNPFRDISLIDEVKDNLNYSRDKINQNELRKIINIFFNNKKLENYFSG